MQRLAHRRHGEGKLFAVFALGAAGVAHREGQASQIGPFAPQRLDETIRLLGVEMIDLGDLMGDAFQRFHVADRRGRLKLNFRDAAQIVSEQRTGDARSLRWRGQELF